MMTQRIKQLAVQASYMKYVAIAAVGVALVSAVVSPVGARADEGDFAASCRRLTVYGADLSASCRRVDGSWTWSWIDLSRYVANDDGELVEREDGRFDESCDDVWVSDDGVLEAQCRDRDGDSKFTAIDLNGFIANYDGTLTSVR